MPEVGDSADGKDIGKPERYKHNKFIWCQCPRCGYERWAFRRLYLSSRRHCKKCAIVVAYQGG
jgi:ribosomal protein S27E